MKEQAQWDEIVDVIVVGSGASGLSAALTAHFEGLRPLVLEKTGRIGGSSAISGGAVWLPLTEGAEQVGHPDSWERVWAYLQETVGSASPDIMKTAYLEFGPRMLQYLTAKGALELLPRAYSPDYYPDRPGASLGGRSMDPAPFDGRLLGKDGMLELRDPLKEFLVLGGMMVNITDVNHLLNAHRSWASFRHGVPLVLRYWMDRARGYHRGTRLLLGNALVARLFHVLRRQGIPYRFESPVQRILKGHDGAVRGVETVKNGRPWRVRAGKGVVIASGGFPWNAAMREQQFPAPTGPWSMAPQTNTGDGIGLAISAGATMGSGHTSPAFWAPVSLLKQADGRVIRYPHLVWDRAKPGLIAVNQQGVRFVNESASYHEFVLGMQRQAEGGTSNTPAWLVCDARFIEKWGLGLALPGGRPREHLIDSGYLKCAPSLEGLASQMNVDATRFKQTVDRYNRQAEEGRDADFGKGSTAYNRYLGDPAHEPNPCLAPLSKAPYYAVQVYPGDIGTACGVRTDTHARALDTEGRVIPGLFVVGNDMQSVMGGAYPGPGITLGPGLTFGWVAAQCLAGKLPAEQQSLGAS